MARVTNILNYYFETGWSNYIPKLVIIQMRKEEQTERRRVTTQNISSMAF
jgi:hypothetical protein